MKKIIISAIAAAFAILSAQAYDWQAAAAISVKINNGLVTDAAVLEEAQKFCDSAKPETDAEKISVINLRSKLNFQRAGGKIAWADHKKFVDDAIAAAKLTKAPSTGAYLGCLYVWWDRSFDNEVYALMKTLPDYQKWGNGGHVAGFLEKWEESYNLYLVSAIFPERAVAVAGSELNDPVRAFEAAKLILTNEYSARTVQLTLENVTRYVAGNEAVPAEQLKAFLINANRRYSVKMVSNKEAWEPIVTMIRTLLETY